MSAAALAATISAVEQLGFGRVEQVAFHAPDIASAAARWTKIGAGPFYLLEHVALAQCLYRGAPGCFDHSSAYGQSGDVMVELIHQHDDRPSPVRDMYGATDEGPHHAAVFTADLDAAARACAARGFAIALDATTTTGVRFLMADARSACGVMLELYEPCDALTKFYGFIRRKSEGWTNEAPLLRL
jgi:hypothetical protein